MDEEFLPLIGNEMIKAHLQRMLQKRTIANSFLFAGADGIGKSLFAQALAAALICQNDPHGIQRLKIKQGNHPDIQHFRPEGKLGMHSIQSLRQLNELVHFPPYEADWKIFIIHEAERMLSYSANALLKTFEEPPAFTAIILVSSYPQSILPTILSRCRTVRFQPISQQDIEAFLVQRYQIAEPKAKIIAKQANGSLGKAIHLIEREENPNREVIFKVLSKGRLENYQDLIRLVNHLSDSIENTKKQAEALAKEEFCKVPMENFSAQQQHLIEKELEGAVAISQTQSIYALFDLILSWYRDLHLLLLRVDPAYLFNPDYTSNLEQVVQYGNLISLEKIQKMIDEARLSVQKSVSLPICLENLFLKLNLL